MVKPSYSCMKPRIDQIIIASYLIVPYDVKKYSSVIYYLASTPVCTIVILYAHVIVHIPG